jgi:hypothetical protein
MPGDCHDVWQCLHADCRAVQRRERVATPLDDRRQRAREAFYDGSNSTDVHPNDLEAAIETATRVRVDDEQLAAFATAWHAAAQDGPPGTRRRAGLIAAFRAAGYEVEQ